MAKPSPIGGQAVVEGIMMRAPDQYAVAVRRPDGTIALDHHPFVSITRTQKVLNLPIVRGAIVLWETLQIGMAALSFAAEQAGDETPRDAAKPANKTAERLTMVGSMVLAFGAGLLLFFWLPLVLTGWLVKSNNGFVFNLVDGLIRLVFFFAYIALIGQWKEMKRVFEYHGAEHMAIHTLEAGEPLEPRYIGTHSPRHPRCGTNFLFLTMISSIIVFVFLGRPHTLGDRLIRLCFVPVVAGVAYELTRLSGMFADKSWAKPLLWPGLALQAITTKYPSIDQMEVAVHALDAVLDPETRARHHPVVVSE